ncbi:FtsW/RodA/SpoVE family cell cycle protein [Bacillus marinisedimentorum]|uniref:FtsW/RodA/SpoVE family cell cycle protein n=1 Tax=Bacillus marinisedimentorum TaxID=1821260 RepID=UPI0007DECB96|nr:FtsW/RodA/SpoVE family cell cycle protein [Bacillus marinisedimentorum]
MLNRYSKDRVLLFIIGMFFVISLLGIYSAQSTQQYSGNFLIKQLMWYGVGTAAMLLVALVNVPAATRYLAWPGYIVGLALLIGLNFLPASGSLITAPVINGTQGWYEIAGLGAFQPSELMKIFLIVALASVIHSHKQKGKDEEDKTGGRLFLKMILVWAIPSVLVLEQPDIGTVLVYLSILFVMLIISGINLKVIGSILLVILGGLGLFFLLFFQFPSVLELVLKKYQLARLSGWLEPFQHAETSGFQLVQSLSVIGDGKLSGAGYLATETHLPEAHSDFIFTIISGEFGFIGAAVLLLLYFVLIARMINIAFTSVHPVNRYIITGIIGMITFHVFENIGMTIGLLPITGIPLPFISYGGSSLLANMAAVGIVLSVYSHSDGKDLPRRKTIREIKNRLNLVTWLMYSLLLILLIRLAIVML